MKQKILLLVFILTILICISSILSLNCTKERYSFNSGVEIRSYVNNHPKMVNKIKIPDDYSPCPIKSISSSTCSGSARYSDTITAEKICELNATNSYYKVISKTSSYYNSCSDNTIWYWDVNKNDGVVAPACNFNSILDTLTCEREVCKTQCSDGIDNDNDEKIDWPNDEGCLNADDDNEYGEPIGYLDAVRNCNDVFGWVCDPDDFNSVVDVHLYKDGPVGAGGSLLAIVKANVKRESAVGNLCGGNSTHGFSFPLPANLKNGTQQKIYAYGINLGTHANNVKLSGSPLSFTCAPECTEKDTIFKVLNSEKSKAAVYNDINFFNQICYNKIFPPANPPFTAPQTCSANNKNLVLWLKSNSDSTVSTTQSTEFNIPVCYGDLKCRTIDTRQSQSCNPEDEMLVVSLSDTTNALVSKGNYIDYPIKICCKSQASLNSAFWANMKDESITSADLKDRVRLIAPGKNLKNEQIQFKIYKKETLGGIDFLARDKFITSVHTDKAFDEWIAGKKSDTEFSGGIYYFIATIGGDTSTEKRSGDLIVSDTESNDPPFVNITSPENCNIFFTGNEIEFKQNSYDVDDNFNYEWDFGDGTKLSGNSVNRENYNPKHIYSGDNLGKKTIKLTVRDDRSKSSTDSVSILILNNVQETKTYSCASIKLPENGKTYGREVTHDAEGTYKIKVEPKLSGDLCNKTITCEAGLCPEKVKMNPTCYPSTSALISIISAPTSSSPANYGNIEFCWNHKDFSGNYSANDNCVSGDNGGKSIRKLFTSTGTKNSRLNIKTDISSYEEVSFIVAFDKYTCQVISEDTTSLPK